MHSLVHSTWHTQHQCRVGQGSVDGGRSQLCHHQSQYQALPWMQDANRERWWVYAHDLYQGWVWPALVLGVLGGVDKGMHGQSLVWMKWQITVWMTCKNLQINAMGVFLNLISWHRCGTRNY